MSATTKKKHVTKEVLEEYPLPDGKKQIVKVTAARGNNLHEVLSSKGETFLVSMPPKFRKHVWIKRGDYIMIEPIEEGDKVKGEITHILFKDQVKHIQEQNLWPEIFTTKCEASNNSMIPNDLLPPSDDDDSDNEGLADLVVNMNRVNVGQLESESEDSCSEEEEEEEEYDNDQKECDSKDTKCSEEEASSDSVHDIAEVANDDVDKAGRALDIEPSSRSWTEPNMR